MALVPFLAKQSESEPSLSDFFTNILGYFDRPWEVSSYTANSSDYNIIYNEEENLWYLLFNSNLLRLVSRLDASNKNLIYINPEYFGLTLQEVYLNNNNLTCETLNDCLHFWATNQIVGKYIINVSLDFNNNITTSCLEFEYINTLLSRGWIMTSEYLYPPDTTATPTPTPTITPSSTDIIYSAVQTIGGIGVLGNRDGIVKDSCEVPVLQFPTPTPTNTPSRFIGLRVDTIAGKGPSGRGSLDGDSCIYAPASQTPTITPTITPTPTTSNLHILTVKTIGGIGEVGSNDGIAKGACEIVPPTPTPTPFYGPQVYTIAGKGSEGDLDGDSCIPITPTPSTSLSPTATPTLSLSNTPTPSPTLTPSSTNYLSGSLVVTPPVEEPCCKEPAVAPGYGSTTFNSRVTSYAKLLNRIKSTLGYPLIQLEITDEQIFNAIDVSLETFTKFTGYTEEYLIFRSDLYKKGYGLPIGDLFSITPEMTDPTINPACRNLAGVVPGMDIDAGARRKVMNVFTVQPGDNSGINTLFTIEQTIAQQAYFGHLLGNVGFDLITFDVLKMWLKTREKVLALKPYFRFYPENQILRITPEPDLRSTPYFGIVGAYVQKPIRELVSQIWIYKYTMAQIKITMGHIRGKYGGTGVFGGQTVNYTDLMSQGLKEIDELEKELKTDLIDREPIPFFVG